ncbi:MAG: hypothetical protein IEMM0002_0497 [bacterium]|nr:MAG: hypothetical protein IEMM0002_0497 [bacterium]
MRLRYNIPVFEKLTERELVSIYNIAEVKRYKTGEIIIREGDTDQTFYLILEGSVGIFKETRGRQNRIAILTGGDWVGEIALVRNTPRVASAVMFKPSVLMGITPKAFYTLPKKLQSHIQKHLYELSTKRLELLQSQNMIGKQKTKELGSYINQLQKKNDDAMAETIDKIIKKIPKLPRYAGDLAMKLLDEKTSAVEVAESIKTDPSLTSLVLKSVNSAYYGLPSKVSDLYRAFLLLGFSQISQLVLDSGIKKTMPNTEEFRELQTHSYIVSIIAHEISTMAGRKNKCSVNSTIGLLHDLGKSIIFLLKRQNPRSKELIGLLNHANLGTVLLSSWGLPENVCTIIELQSLPEFTPPENMHEESRDELSVLYIAHRCADQLSEDDDKEKKHIYFHEYMSNLNLPDKSIEEFFKGNVLQTLVKNQKQYPEKIREIIQNKSDED